MIEPGCLIDGDAGPPLFHDHFVDAGKWFRGRGRRPCEPQKRKTAVP
jgi:hypothetical protein